MRGQTQRPLRWWQIAAGAVLGAVGTFGWFWGAWIIAVALGAEP